MMHYIWGCDKQPSTIKLLTGIIFWQRGHNMNNFFWFQGQTEGKALSIFQYSRQAPRKTIELHIKKRCDIYLRYANRDAICSTRIYNQSLTVERLHHYDVIALITTAMIMIMIMVMRIHILSARNLTLSLPFQPLMALSISHRKMLLAQESIVRNYWGMQDDIFFPFCSGCYHVHPRIPKETKSNAHINVQILLVQQIRLSIIRSFRVCSSLCTRCISRHSRFQCRRRSCSRSSVQHCCWQAAHAVLERYYREDVSRYTAKGTRSHVISKGFTNRPETIKQEFLDQDCGC